MKNWKAVVIACLAFMAIGAQAQTVKMSVNDGWHFTLGDKQEYSQANFNDNEWQSINLPHTWNTDAYVVANYHRGTGWYRRSLTLPRDLQDKHLYLYFEGASKAATLYINGQLVGEHPGGYTAFSYDITPYINASGTNSLAVKVDNTRQDIVPISADFTFFGGIYRDVWLLATGDIHLDHSNLASDGVFVSTPQVSDQQATVQVKGKISNFSGRKADVEIQADIYTPSGQLVQSVKKALTLKEQQQGFELLSKPVASPILWTPETPNLYKVVTTVRDKKSHEVLDEREVMTGFRWFSFDADKGFFLNGKPYKLHGMCRHQDQKPIGPAMSDETHRRDMILMKEMGTNFIRISHYPQDPAILEMCDRLGLLVWEEIPIVNLVPDTPGFNENAELNLREMIHQHYNHPSVILWGYMNEVLLMTMRGPEAEQQAAIDRVLKLAEQLEQVLHEEDATRLSTMAFHGSDAYNSTGIADITQVVGWNIYNGWYGANMQDFDTFMEKQHTEHPTHPIIVSEYGAGSDKRIHSLQPKAFDFSTEYQQLFLEHYVPVIENTPYLTGGTHWNFIDFSSASRNESMPRINNKGLVRADRTPKDVFYYYKATWRTDIPVLHIASNDWNQRVAIVADGQTAIQPVKVYTNLDEVELFIDGKSLGKQRVENHHAIFQVPLSGDQPLLLAQGNWQGKQVQDALRLKFKTIPAHLNAQNIEGVELAINVGSNCFFTSDESNLTWVPDQAYTEGGWGYLGGKERSSQTEIKNTTDGPLYQTQRTDLEGYRFDVPQGTYEVELLLADLSQADAYSAYLLGRSTGSGQAESIFTVTIGDKVLETISSQSMKGSFNAQRHKFIVKNTTDHLEVCFDALSGSTYLNGIKLRKID